MEIRAKRTPLPEYTHGILQIDHHPFECFTLEDPERQVKIAGDTAIPRGRYEVIINWSDRFKQYMPLLLNVPGYAGVRIHWGNRKSDTHGCLLLGFENPKDGFMGESVKAYKAFMKVIKAVEKKEKIWITIE
jgi:hypothetical protein